MKKEDLQKGDVILFPPHDGDIIAKAIAYLTDGEVNHAALCYPGEDGLLMIAESILKDGLVLNPFPEHIDEEYPLRICRMTNSLAVEPLLKATGKYLDEKNAYPNFNLGLLGGLLLFKKFAPHTLRNKIVYMFFGLVADLLMELVRKRKYAGKHPMSCSQFVAQCFTDAGEDYDLYFERLVVQFDNVKLQSGAGTRAMGSDMIAPIELLMREKNQSSNNVENVAPELNLTDSEAQELTNGFINILEGHEGVQTRSANVETVSSDELNATLQSIALSLYELHTGEKAKNTGEAIASLQLSTMRNYFVSPQDLLVNCPDSLKLAGLLSY